MGFPSLAQPADIDAQQHVVVLMLENRSFDQMLGVMKKVYGEKLDGVDPEHLYSNRVSPTEIYQQKETKTLCIPAMVAPIDEDENAKRVVRLFVEQEQNKLVR